MYPEMVELLLDFGADPNVRTVDGRTPLMEAVI
jgi:ankyrin repeat protein